MMNNLSKLIDPISKEEFIEKYWQKEMLLIKRNNPHYWDLLLHISQVDEILTTTSISPPDVLLVNAEHQLHIDKYTRNGQEIDALKLFQFFSSGNTIILNQLHKKIHSLGVFCESMEYEFGLPFQTNIYLTPPHAQGFTSHFDTHDVFILQITGSKTWRIYNRPIVNPLLTQSYDSNTHKISSEFSEFVLNQGDTLYIPSGLIHEAFSNDTLSMHITLGGLYTRLADFVNEVIKTISENVEDLRASLPFFVGRDKDDIELLTKKIKKIFEMANLQDYIIETKDRMVRKSMLHTRPIVKNQLFQITNNTNLPLDRLISIRPNLKFTIKEDKDKITLNCFNETIVFPIKFSSIIHFIILEEKFYFAQIKSELDENLKIEIIQQLIRIGFITFILD
ncbi:MAG: cupin domain-containing protein [Bacteroidota bacterium]